jgi:hypothetical protein
MIMKKVCLTLALAVLTTGLAGAVNAQSPMPGGYSFNNITKFEVGPRATQRFNQIRSMTWSSTDGAVAPVVVPNACGSCCDDIWDSYCLECGHGGCSPKCHDHGKGHCGCQGGHGGHGGDCGCDSGCDSQACGCGHAGHGGGLLGGLFGSHGGGHQDCGCGAAQCASAGASGDTMAPWSTDGVAPPSAPLPQNQLPSESAALRMSAAGQIDLCSLESQDAAPLSPMDAVLQGEVNRSSTANDVVCGL